MLYISSLRAFERHRGLKKRPYVLGVRQLLEDVRAHGAPAAVLGLAAGQEHGVGPHGAAQREEPLHGGEVLHLCQLEEHL